MATSLRRVEILSKVGEFIPLNVRDFCVERAPLCFAINVVLN